MKKTNRYLVSALALSFLLGNFEIAGQQVSVGLIKIATEAQARIGRPATPGSVAGVARRTTRRVIRRGAYIAAVPAGCAYGTYYGYRLYYCGGVYYQASGSGYVIVYF